MKNLIFSYQGEEYVDLGVYERTLRAEALKQGIVLDEEQLEMLLDEVEANGKAENYRGITEECILNKYLNFIR
jgi:hypothetical protein